MTKDQYFEMCEMMGTDPIDEEIPLEYADLPDEVQEAMTVYNMLQDNWDDMNGVYMGKVMAGVSDVFNIVGIEDPKTIYFILNLLDRQRSEILNAKHKQKATK
jgi:hypothetical protein